MSNKTSIALVNDDFKLTFDERKGFGKADKILTPEELLAEFIKSHNLSYDYKSNSVKDPKDKILSDKLVTSMLRLYALESGHEFLKSFLIDAFRVWKNKSSIKAKTDLQEKLRFRKLDTNELSKFIHAVAGKEDELLKSVLAHFIWQTKRKINELPVEHHMLICFYGASGAGKSVAIQKLLSPIFDFKIDSDFSIFSDKFSGHIWERNFVILCDEMGEIKNTSVERLKNIITADRVESRAMRSDQLLSIKQNATFITASNVELRDLIFDPTSARRYFQIDCQDRIDWDLINEIDYGALWRSVDELGPCPIIPFLSEIRAIQEEKVRSKCNIEQFIEEACVIGEFESNSPTTQEIYKEFVTFCRGQGISTFEGIQQFSRRLPKVIGPNASSKRTNRGTVWPLITRSSVS